MSEKRNHARAGTAAVDATLALAVVGCGGGEGADGPPPVQWYINPDGGSQAEIASRCTQSARGRYRIETSLLPRSASDQRGQLPRRLAAQDRSIDLMSLDPVFVAGFAEAGFPRELDAETPRTQLIATLDAETSVDDGQQIELALDPGDLHLFDPVTGSRLALDPLRRAA